MERIVLFFVCKYRILTLKLPQFPQFVLLKALNIQNTRSYHKAQDSQSSFS